MLNVFDMQADSDVRYQLNANKCAPLAVQLKLEMDAVCLSACVCVLCCDSSNMPAEVFISVQALECRG